ncbi:HAMP domain-containing histidine kinase [Clostridium sporogenes]|uniref:histidine kinase n=1 Tax=Clostridium botulinum TaxID=1491 RepID=A0A6M0SXD9_CLOBO|nr:HAMP domain-containing sensor histidine kinase [Clostridium sporogenes]NFA60166.1 HAMP domain-containing histidine kinase [Clostridium botulinum]NFI72859.1 HAMP domain-containing histidine kinase [Clostridium sporogenes]NFL73166.1 HAMP domain-containing histidine kinase [Clostridium sporogenes]NFM23367.1 HAMP domain-containing histidine kinase [Clostridium sporogenes]NFP60272.1 HAMP domain-containing histidine kinase [Clostridium sporogenes]
MDINKKQVTLKRVFFRYLLALAFAFCVAIIIGITITSLGMKMNFFNSANYSEDLARRAKPILQSTEKITEDMIPNGCKFAVFDKEFKVTKTDLTGEDLKEATLYAKGIDRKSGDKKTYYFIERKDGFCILQYYIKMTYSLEWMNEYLPNPQLLLIIILILGCLIGAFIISIVFARNLKNNLIPLIEATEKIKEQDLEFDIGNSPIKEFDDVLSSISDMKDELKESLKEQWNLENAKKEQIASLAHDIKTPLTIIKGNTELLKESSVSDEQKDYIKFIEKNSNQIERYIKLLIDMSNGKIDILQNLEKSNAQKFAYDIYNQLIALAGPKKLQVKFEEKDLPENIIINKEAMHRAIINVISNAVEYSPFNSNLYFSVEGKDNYLEFSVIDSGKGFSSRDLKVAKKQFYMSDSSRTSKIHWGMGLYIADSIVKQHNGTLIIKNSQQIGGAQVIIKIPL